MFDRTKEFLTKVGVALGIIKDLKNVNQLKSVNVSEDYYNYINKWKNLHRGFDKSIHLRDAYSIHRGEYQRQIATLNMPKVISQEISNLIFNERANISVTSNSDLFDQLIQDMFKRNNFNGNFQQYLEFMFAHGGVVIKPYLDGDEINLSYSLAENFIPISWENDYIYEGLFINSIRKGKKYYKLIEWHTFNEDNLYEVRNELYVSDSPEKIGTKTNLASLYPDLVEVVTYSPQVDRPLFVYMKPNTANNIENDNPLGISIYANSMDSLKLVDTIYDSLLEEFDLGRKKIMVSSEAIRHTNNRDGSQRRYFDTRNPVYEAINSTNDADFIKEINSTLRINEHVEGLNAALDTISLQCGFSPGTFSFSRSGGLKTATEVISENSKTFRTKKGHENLIETGIKDLIEITALIADEFGLLSKPTEIEVTVSFDDSIIQDRTATITDQITLVNSRLQPRVDAIEAIFEITTEEAIAKLRRVIQEERDELPDMQTLIDSLTDNGDIE